jgi:sugar/nucleoside kinase (ribokinase family)
VSDVLVAGHASLDLYPQLYHQVRFEPGRLVIVGPVSFSPGGAVTNTGVALHRLGVDVRLVGKVGTDLFGRTLLEALEQRGAGLAGDMIVSASAVTSYTIVINPPGLDRSFLHCPGANETFNPQDIPDALLAGIRLFHFGYPPLMPQMFADNGALLRQMFSRIRSAGSATSLDTCAPDPDSEAGRADWEKVLALTLPFVDIFAPSIDELLFMLDHPAHLRLRKDGLSATVDRARLAELGDQLIAMGACVAAIKLGDQGLYLQTAADADRVGELSRRLGLRPEAWVRQTVLAPCFLPNVVAGTTGSGDATIAGLLAAMLRGASPLDAATAATAVGACSVEAIDPTSGIPEWPSIANRISGGWKRCELTIDLGDDATVRPDATGTLALA